MGRVSRHTKIKAIDPFSRTGGFVDVDKGKVFNVAPRPRDLEALPKGVARLVALQAMAAANKSAPAAAGSATLGGGAGIAALAARETKAQPVRHFSHMRAFPGESLATFNKRVNVERRKQRAEAAAAPVGSRLSEKRRGYLEARRRKRGGGVPAAEDGTEAAPPPSRGSAAKRPRAGDGVRSGPDRDDPRPMDFPTAESVPFGERAMEPPRLLAAPRQSQKQKARLAAAQEARKLVRAANANVEGASREQLDAAAAAAQLLVAERASQVEGAQMARYKGEVAAAYQALKRQRAEGHQAALVAGAKKRRVAT